MGHGVVRPVRYTGIPTFRKNPLPAIILYLLDEGSKIDNG